MVEDVTINQLLQRISQLESEQKRLKLELDRIAQEQDHDHSLLMEVQRQLSLLYKEIEDIKSTISTKIEEGNKLILEQNKLMMNNSEKHLDKIYKLVIVLIIALLLVIGVKGLSAISWFS